MTDPLVFVAVGVAVVVLLLFRLRKGDRLFNHRQQRESARRWGGERCAYRWPVTWHRCRDGIEWDHQIAYSRGGRTRSGNCQPLCGAANRRKGATFNGWYVIRHGWVVGTLIYFVRWMKAEVFR